MNTNKLKERLQRLQEKKGGGGGSKNFFKAPTDGKSKAIIRQVPYPHNDDNAPFIEVGWHYNVAGVRSTICPRETFGDPCPICELAEEYRSMGTKDTWRIFKKLSAKLRYYSPVVIRGQEDAGVKLWGYGSTIYEALLEKYLDEDWGNLSDVTNGRDLKVWTIPKESPNNDTDFAQPKMDVVPSPSKLLEKKADIVELLKSIPNYLEDGETFPVKSYTELRDIVAKFADPDQEDDDQYEDLSDSDDDSDDDDDESQDSSSGDSLADDLEDLLKG